MNKKNWYNFMLEAKSHLFTESRIEFGSAFISLILEPSFENHFRFLINWDNKKERVIWEKMTWEMLVDAPKFDNKQQVDENVVPTISIQKGSFKKERIEKLIDLTNSITIKPQLNPEKMWTLDGTFSTLKIGRFSDSITFSWHTLPEGWNELEVLIDEISTIEDMVTKE